jgi:hypothetical protein
VWLTFHENHGEIVTHAKREVGRGAAGFFLRVRGGEANSFARCHT